MELERKDRARRRSLALSAQRESLKNGRAFNSVVGNQGDGKDTPSGIGESILKAPQKVGQPVNNTQCVSGEVQGDLGSSVSNAMQKSRNTGAKEKPLHSDIQRYKIRDTCK